jgi:phosphatidylglycerol---prolipoprotein diacylglyceryl transferase
MIPVLVDLGPVKIYSFGLMLAIAFLTGSYILTNELRRRHLDPEMGTWITLLGVVFGIGGAKILYLIENLKGFLQDPLGEAFSPGGLTWYGGLILALAVVTVYIRRKRVPILRVWDCLGIALILAYGIGRIGCHLAGDGDYGTPTNLPWGTVYAQGIVKPSSQLQEYFSNHPDERQTWKYDALRLVRAGIDRRGLPYSRFDADTPLHPTPIYEFLLGIVGFLLLRRLSKNSWPDGVLFTAYLVLASIFRFTIEFWRLNPRLAFGLTEAQLIAVCLFLLGLAGTGILFRRHTSTEP